MSSYNIYSGLKSQIAPIFQYVMHNVTYEEALDEAKDLAIEIFEDSGDFGELWDECFNIAIEKIDKLPEYSNLMYNWIVTEEANRLYEEQVDDFIIYDATLYEE